MVKLFNGARVCLMGTSLMNARCVLVFLVQILLAVSSRAQVVINEIFYDAPDDLTDLQWVELYNTGEKAVNLAGWRLTKGVKFEFGPGVTMGPHGYVVVCKNRQRFQDFYPRTDVAGEFSRSLKHSGERIELHNPAGEVVDSVEFGNRPPWPRGANGWSASIERICPTVPGSLAENWAGSPLSEEATQPGGTPGAKNAAFCATLPPVVSDVSFRSNCVAPNQPIEVEAQVRSKTEVKEVRLLYRVIGPGSKGEERVLPMSKAGTATRYSASIPGQQAGQIVRFRIHALDQNAAERFYPSATEPRPALSCLVFTNVTPGKIPQAYLIHTDADEAQNALRQLKNGSRGAPPGPEAQAKFMAQMEFRAALDLAGLWSALTLGNGAPAELDKLRPIFKQQEGERAALGQQVLAGATPQETEAKISELIKPFKDTLGEALKPVLSADQMRTYEAWREGKPGSGGARGNDPALMLRQFIRLEPDYLHLAISSNITTAQFESLRVLYRDAIQQRDALVPEVRKLMSGQREENQAEGEKLQAKAMAIPAAVEEKLKKILTPGQARQFSAWQMAELPSFMRQGRSKPPKQARGDAALVLVEPQAREPKLFDFVQIPERSGGWKVHLGKDQPWNGMTVIDLIFEASDRWLLSEPLAYDLYRRAGLAACRTDFFRLIVDGQPAGYYLLIEQVNKAFLRNNGLRDDGNLYKANWVGNGLVGQHQKHINRHTGHDDLIELANQLEKAKNQPEEQWLLIRRELDVNQILNHYAVRMLISDWDGFFNNYWLYHDLHGTKKWTLYPWDEDKTWGEYDGWERDGPLYDMPLTYGSEGDHPPGEPGGRPSTSYGFRAWWRAGGFISRPVLANPSFRKFLFARMKQLLDTEFTEARLFPLVDTFKDRLAEEVQYRAQVMKEDPDLARKRFESDLASLKDFVTKRRQWLLEQAEIKTAEPFDPAHLKGG
jgi:hypothetical protein